MREATCFRCGAFFETATGRVCAGCRRPRLKSRAMLPIGGALTRRESSIVQLVARGLMNKEIAYELRLTEGTIKEYLNRLFRKLSLRNRVEMAVWASRHSNAA